MQLCKPDTIAVFGGSGATGRQIIEQAVGRGLRVRTLVRETSAFEPPSGAVEVITGSLENPKDVERTLCGCDAVCCAFGPRPPFTDIFCARATSIIVAAMQKCEVSRIICQTGAMIGDYRQNRTTPFQSMAWLFNSLKPRLAEDREGQERVIRASGLRWTIVKPPRLTNQSTRGVYTAGPKVKVGLLSAVSRADLATFIIRELLSPAHVREIVFIRRRFRERQRVFTGAEARLLERYRLVELSLKQNEAATGRLICFQQRAPQIGCLALPISLEG
jgi:putative NADH-flavin reductase